MTEIIFYENICPKCNSLCKIRMIRNGSTVYDCNKCKDQISEEAIIKKKVRR